MAWVSQRCPHTCLSGARPHMCAADWSTLCQQTSTYWVKVYIQPACTHFPAYICLKYMSLTLTIEGTCAYSSLHRRLLEKFFDNLVNPINLQLFVYFIHQSMHHVWYSTNSNELRHVKMCPEFPWYDTDYRFVICSLHRL